MHGIDSCRIIWYKILSQLRFDITYSLKTINLFLVLKQLNICIGECLNTVTILTDNIHWIIQD